MSETFSAWFSGEVCVFPRWLCTTIQISLALWGTCSLSMAARGKWLLHQCIRASSYRESRCRRHDNNNKEHNNNNNGEKLRVSSEKCFSRRQSKAARGKANFHDTSEPTGKFCICFPSARCWLRHENRTRLNGPSSRRRSQSSWAAEQQRAERSTNAQPKYLIQWAQKAHQMTMASSTGKGEGGWQ